MKKIFNVLYYVLMTVLVVGCIITTHMLDKKYDQNLGDLKTTYEAKIESIKDSYESKYNQLNDSKVELENQIYNCMTGEPYDFTIRHDDETHNWYATDNKGIFRDKTHIICY